MSEDQQALDEEIINGLAKTIGFVDGITNSQIYNDEIGVLIDRAKNHPSEALEACRRTHNRTAEYVKREVHRYLNSLR